MRCLCMNASVVNEYAISAEITVIIGGTDGNKASINVCKIENNKSLAAVTLQSVSEKRNPTIIENLKKMNGF